MGITMESMPAEILQMILKNLKGTEVAACRAVSRRWRDHIDSFSESTWKHYCRRDFWSPQKTQKPSHLSYRDLYKSLAQWNKVEEAEVISKKMPLPSTLNVPVFNIIDHLLGIAIEKDRVIVPGRGSVVFHISVSNSIEYYDIVSLKFISRVCYSFLFEDYEENEKMIILMGHNYILHIIIKANKKQFIYNLFNDKLSYYSVFSDKVYFLNSKEVVVVARLKEVNGEELIETEELGKIGDSDIDIIAFSQNGNEVNILASNAAGDDMSLKMYRSRGKNFYLWDNSTQSIVKRLKDYGFLWSDTATFHRLNTYFDSKQIKITKFRSAMAFTHFHVVLLSTSQCNIHIYKQPYDKNGELKLYNAKSNKIIRELNSKYIGSDIRTGIKQLEVFELAKGPRIFILIANKIFILDLIYKPANTVEKRRIAHGEQLSPKSLKKGRKR